jgi:hypothetical protein
LVAEDTLPLQVLPAKPQVPHQVVAVGFSLLNQSYGPFAGVGISIPVFNGHIYRKQKEVADINTHNGELAKDSLIRN